MSTDLDHSARTVAAADVLGSIVVHVRYFAAAGEAAGVAGEDVVVPAGATVADLVAALTRARGAALGRVLAISSLLVDDVTRVVGDDDAAILTTSTEARVDVLPPFAGG